MLKSAASAVAAIGIAAIAGTGALAGSETAQQGKEASASETVLLTQPLEGIEGKEANVVMIEVPPGWQTPAHRHPGDLFIYVLEGSVEIALEGGGTLTASAGEVIHEPPDHPMVGRNLSATEPARIVVFQVGDEGAPLTVPHE